MLIKQTSAPSEKIYFPPLSKVPSAILPASNLTPAMGIWESLDKWNVHDKESLLLLCAFKALLCQTFSQSCQQITEWAYLGLQTFIPTHSCPSSLMKELTSCAMAKWQAAEKKWREKQSQVHSRLWLIGVQIIKSWL